MPNKRSDWNLSQVIHFLSRSDVEFRIKGWKSTEAAKEVLSCAVKFLNDYQDKQDALEVANLDLAEVGRILRNQRQTIQKQDICINEERQWAGHYQFQADQYRSELERLGAL